MPEAPLKQCARCKRVLTRDPYCPACTEIKNKQYQNNRNKDWQHLYGSKWQKARWYYLRKHPLCEECLRNDITTPLIDKKYQGVVDHIVPHKGNVKLFWDRNNWQSLCTSCHNKKTAKEGAFGR